MTANFYKACGCRVVRSIIWYFIFRDGVDPMPSITPAGFQFLLMDTGSQVWYFMLQYLETVEVTAIPLAINGTGSRTTNWKYTENYDIISILKIYWKLWHYFNLWLLSCNFNSLLIFSWKSWFKLSRVLY